jgi:uncharacterized protein (UPF0335 family)
MSIEYIRNLINICESRQLDNPNVAYHEPDTGSVVATLRSYNSQTYTKLAVKVERIQALETEISQLKDEIKQETRENVADLFDAEDAVRTRVIDTISFIMTLSKDPKATVTPKYKDILEALSQQLTPELIEVLENLKKTMVTVTQKSPSLKISRKDELTEGYLSAFTSKIKDFIYGWAKRYDRKLDSLKQAAGL